MSGANSINNGSYLDNANIAFQERFQDLYGATAPGSYQTFAEVVPTDAKVTQVDAFGAFGATWREWVGPKVFMTTRLYTQQVTLKRWEKSFYLDRMDYQYDRTGKVGRKINQFLSGASFYDKIATDVLVANGTGYDGVALYSSSHPHGASGATQSNVTTSAFSENAVEAAMIAMQSYQDEAGEPLGGGIVADTIMVGPKNMIAALEFAGVDRKVWVKSDGTFGHEGATSTSIVGGFAMNNIWQGKFTVVVNPRLVGAYDDYWYLFSSSTGAKAVIIYEGRAPVAIAKTQMEDDLRFFQDKMAWSMEADAVGASGAWMTTYAGIL